MCKMLKKMLGFKKKKKVQQVGRPVEVTRRAHAMRQTV